MRRSRRARVLGVLAAFALATGIVSVAAGSARAAVSCPTVDPSTGSVTPAPAPGVDWAGCDLADAYLPGASLNAADLADANLNGAYLVKADVAGATLTGANLSHASGAGANFSDANLAGATLTIAEFSQADLARANLTNVSAVSAVFQFVDLTDATLNGADLTAADLSSTDLVGATGLPSATTTSVTWTNAICPNHLSANDYTGGCVGTVSVTTPSAAPAISGGTLGDNGWYRSPVTVSWYWADSNAMDNCPATTTSVGQGPAVTITASCTDSAGNTGKGSLSAAIDTTPPAVSIIRVRPGGIYQLDRFPLPTCAVTDVISGVGSYGVCSLYSPVIPGTKQEALAGVWKMTLSGATDKAGNAAHAISAQWTLVYLFGGYYAPKVGSTLSHTARDITVKAFLADNSDKAIAAAEQAARAKYHQIRATLRGPGITAVTVACSWNAKGKYLQCVIPTPRKVETGRSHRYTITVAENVGSGWITVPDDAASQNPAPVYFK
jgi:Pentapeptide repeats (8 copies)